MLNESTIESLILLLRYAFGNESGTFADGAVMQREALPADVDWQALIEASAKHGIAQICNDGYRASGLDKDSRCTLNTDKNRKLRLTWMGLDIPFRMKYENHHNILLKLAEYFKDNGVSMVLLKGYGLSLNYPIPEHRPSSDIDIYCHGNHDKSNKLIEQKNITIDYGEHKHTTFCINGVPVENHHSFLNIHGHRSTAEIEQILKELISKEEPQHIENFYLPSPNFNALYLLRHMAENFTASVSTLRQLTDWALYIKRHHDDIDWKWYVQTTEKVGMKQYLDIISAISVEHLGFDKCFFHEYHVDNSLVERCYNDIISPEFSEEHPSTLIAEVFFKLRRWKSNIWKHRIVYANESLVGTFLTQLWSHLLKPSSIKFGMK